MDRSHYRRTPPRTFSFLAISLLIRSEGKEENEFYWDDDSLPASVVYPRRGGRKKKEKEVSLSNSSLSEPSGDSVDKDGKKKKQKKRAPSRSAFSPPQNGRREGIHFLHQDDLSLSPSSLPSSASSPPPLSVKDEGGKKRFDALGNPIIV